MELAAAQMKWKKIIPAHAVWRLEPSALNQENKQNIWVHGGKSKLQMEMDPDADGVTEEVSHGLKQRWF